MEVATSGRRTVLQEAVKERLVPHTPSSARVGSTDVKSTGQRAGAGEHRVNIATRQLLHQAVVMLSTC